MQVLRHKTSRFKDNGVFAAEYNLAVEELLEIFIDDWPYAVTMRLPGDDINLAAGFCLTEGIIASRDDLVSIEHCEGTSGQNRIIVRLDRNRANQGKCLERHAQYVSKSSCGICGRSRAEEIYSELRPMETFRQIHLSEVLGLRDLFETRQAVFHLTGSTHSASIFSRGKELLAFAEDIGRHNALDKAIGALVLQSKMREAFLAIVSSRLSFEMVQKAGVLGIEVLSGLSAPTSMAVTMADQLNITLIGFLRENSMSIYTHPERILSS
jgi:FdhD protein